MDLLEVSLERSALPLVPLEGGFSVTTNDFEDARFLPAEKQMEVVVPLPPVTEDGADPCVSDTGGWTTAVRRR